jgi:hypothetical protein
MVRRLIGFLSALSLLALSFLAPAIAAVKSGSACTTLGKTSIASGKTFTCIKSGKKLVWDKGKNQKPAKVIDYSTCLEEYTYTIWPLASGEYSNVAKDFGQAYAARIDKSGSNQRFGNDQLTFTNKTPCKVKVQVIAELSCNAPYGSAAYSYSIGAQTGEIAVPASSTYLINVGKFFPSQKYSCETTSPRVKASMPGPPSGAPYLNFGSSVTGISIKVEGADPAKRTPEQSPTPSPIATP